MTHPDLFALVDLARHAVSPDVEAIGLAHLETCPPCRAVVERLRVVSRGAGRDAATEAPRDAVQRAVEIGRRVDARSGVSVLARLIFDSIHTPVPDGVRASDQPRHAVYEAGRWALDLQVTRSAREIVITGQIADRMDPTHGVGPVPVLARVGRKVVVRTATTERGEFSLAAAPRPDLHLQVLLPPRTVVKVPLQTLLA